MRKILLLFLGLCFILFGVHGFVDNPFFRIFLLSPLCDIASVLVGLLLIAAAALSDRVMQVAAWFFALVYLTIAFSGWVAIGSGQFFTQCDIGSLGYGICFGIAVLLALIGLLPRKDPQPMSEREQMDASIVV